MKSSKLWEEWEKDQLLHACKKYGTKVRQRKWIGQRKVRGQTDGKVVRENGTYVTRFRWEGQRGRRHRVFDSTDGKVREDFPKI